ncbi:hypothetical protein ACFW4K_11400 [Nocardiopsis alba]|uniref:hypothetical protein n=1 Tax=Nocardiopsis alba TaxID=53437 RepID=UPI003670AE21
MSGVYTFAPLITGLLLPLAVGVTLLVLARRAGDTAGLVRAAAILFLVMTPLSWGVVPLTAILVSSSETPVVDPFLPIMASAVVRNVLSLVQYGVPAILLLVALRKASRPKSAGTPDPGTPYEPGPQWPTPGHGPGHGPPSGQGGPPGPPVQGHPSPEGPPSAQGPHRGPPHRPHPGQNPPPGR